MKRLLIAFLLFSPIVAAAQDNVWERMEVTKAEANNPDAPYLKGAVPVVNGRVCFSKTVKVAGKTKDQIYAQSLEWLTSLTKGPEQFSGSRVALTDDEGHAQVAATLQEWLVFKSQALQLDRTRFSYLLTVDCAEGEATISLSRIIYLYEEERDPVTLKAEEWITDKYGLNKAQSKLSRVTGKFRRKTIDRKNYLFGKFEELFAAK